MTRQDARELINTAGREHTLVVYFTKRDGTTRRMVCRYFGAPSSKPHLMVVLDLEKGEPRNINLDTVSQVKVLGKAAGVKAPAPDRPAEPRKRSYETIKAEMDELFY